MGNQNEAQTITELQKKLQQHELALRIEFKTLTKKEKDVLMKTVKLQEEIGELANDILATMALQRKSKLQAFKKRDLYQEFADVILATVSLANGLGVDLDLAIRNKLKRILSEYTIDR